MLKSTDLKENHYYLLTDGRIMLYVGVYNSYNFRWKTYTFIPVKSNTGTKSLDITQGCIDSAIEKEVSFLEAVEESL